ncbi:MAG: aldehyde dehydrogenase family protein [Kordiimonadaceae bacterium]|nr:aldehyde dehydrogenase family protein [Kordiimonadaceae bacterium]MBT7604341.1 aldehyde dehydrogenase family protein [Kordiimonadaceae bacterium]
MNQKNIDILRSKLVPKQSNFIGNKDFTPLSEKVLEVISPIDGKVFSTIAASETEDVDHAVTFARKTFNSGVWANMPPKERKVILLKWADLIEINALRIAVLGVRDNGTEIKMAIKGEPKTAADVIRFYAEAIDKINGEITPTSHEVLSLIQKEPVGVVGIILPWNFPLMVGAWKIAPALAAGNSVVLKPSENASLSLIEITKLAAEAGLPPGVLNVITGEGHVGQALATHMEVDVIAFTGSGSVGRKLLKYSARSNMKRVYLELGGKSPNIVFADAPDLDRAARDTAQSIFRNSGQVCVSASRLIIEEPIYEDFLNAVAQHASSLVVGDPLNLKNTTGSMANINQLEKTINAVVKAKEQGARLVTGGKRLHHESGGYYHEPTIFADVKSEMDISQQEIFGPVLAARSFESEEQAYNVANETIYGLSSVIWTSNLSRAHRSIKAIRSGTAQVNCYSGADITSPLGGHKQSGSGHDRSLYAFDKYINLKSSWINIGS